MAIFLARRIPAEALPRSNHENVLPGRARDTGGVFKRGSWSNEYATDLGKGQNRAQARFAGPARLAVSKRRWRSRDFGRLLPRQARYFGSRLLSLPDALQPGAQWRGRRLAQH